MDTLGLVVTSFGIARVIMDIPAERLVEGRRPILTISPVVVTLSALGSGLATEYWHSVVNPLLRLLSD